MKRNLSSKAIKAMAIGMAVTLGSTTAISGVVNGTVVNTYAADFNTVQFTAKATKDNTSLKITITRDGENVFKADDNTKKLTGLVVKNGEKVVFSSDDGGTINNITSDANTNPNELVITIPSADIKDGSLDGSETSLTITKLTSTDIKYGATSAEEPLNFDAGNLNVITDSPIGIDKTAPTLEDATTIYSSSAGTHTVEITLKENLENLSEKSNTNQFTIERKGEGTESVQVTKYKVENNKLILILDQELTDDTYTVTYVTEDAELKDTAGNKLKTDGTVEVAVDTTAPTITGNAEYNKEAKTVTLTASEDLSNYSETDAPTHLFTVKDSSLSEQPITKVEVTSEAPTKIVITLDSELADDTYTVGYTGTGIADKASNKLAINDSLATFKVETTPASDSLSATTSAGTYTFEKLADNSIALVNFDGVSAISREATSSTFENGVLTVDGTTYTLTQIGNGTTPLTELTNEALSGHTSNVTTIKANAFKGNTSVTSLSCPNVTNVGANAFNGATALITIDLGSATTSAVTVDNSAFTGATALKTVVTNPVSTTNVNDALTSSSITNAIVKTSLNASNATIAAGKYYQTLDGLRFKGLSENTLEFIGSEDYTGIVEGGFDGSDTKPYLVTYNDGTATLQKDITSVDVTTNGYTLTFDVSNNEATLTGAQAATTRVSSTGQLSGGVVTAANGQQFDFTVIGNGTALPTSFDATTVLGDNLNKVTTISANAFSGNTATTELTLPAVKNIGDNAFNNATGLTKVDLTNASSVTIGSNAFTGATSVKVTSDNQTVIDSAIAGGLEQDKIESTKAFVTSAVVEAGEPTKIVLTLNEELTTALSTTTDFAVNVTKDNSPVSYKISTVAGGDSSASGKVTITLDKAIENGQTIELSYTGNEILGFTNKVVTNNIAAVSTLKVVSAVVSNSETNKITITVEGTNLKDISDQATTGFKVTKGGSSATDTVDITANTLNVTGNNTIELTVDSAFGATDENIKVAYDGSGELKAIDESTVKIESQLVDNEQDTTAPTLNSTGTHSDTTITLTSAAKYLMPMDIASDGGFAIKKDSADENLDPNITVTNVKINADSKEIILTLDSALPASTNVKVVYTGVDNKVKDTNGNELANIAYGSGISVASTTVSSRFAPSVASRSAVIPEIAAYSTEETNQEQLQGDVTSINITDSSATKESDIQKMLTSKLTNIEKITLNGSMSLNFENVDVSSLSVDKSAISGTGTLNITGLNSTDKLALAKKLEGSSNITINNETIKDIINDNNSSSNNGGSGSSSSSGGGSGFTGGGANIGNTDATTENTTSSNTNNNNNGTVENKDLTLDIINLPSVTGEAKVFSDVSASHWAKSYIDKLSTAGVINGSNGMFNPNGQTKRADATIMLVNLLGLQPEANSRFADVASTAYYAPYVGTASTYGIVNGSNGMFNPENTISRQDTMVMMAQILKALNLNVNTDTSVLNQFSDVNSVSSYATESVAILVNSGIISGNNGRLNPTSPVTRAEMATIMSKLYDVLESATK